MSAPPRADAAHLAALRQERDFLLASLRDLDTELADGEISVDHHRALRDGYTARAAEVLRRLDGLEQGSGAEGAGESAGAPAPPVAGAADRATGGRRRLRAVVATVGALCFAGGVASVAAGMAGWRSPGQTITGSVGMTPGQELAAARVAMSRGDNLGALKLYDAVLRADPHQAEALAYRGWLVREAGAARNDRNLLAQALASEQAAVGVAPGYPDARFFLGVMLLDDQHEPGAAIPQLEAYLATDPPASAARPVEAVLARARQEASGAGKPPAGAAGSAG